LDKISSITATNINIGATQVPIGQTYKNQVLKLLGSWNLNRLVLQLFRTLAR
jgi:hypothetical protein